MIATTIASWTVLALFLSLSLSLCLVIISGVRWKEVWSIFHSAQADDSSPPRTIWVDGSGSMAMFIESGKVQEAIDRFQRKQDSVVYCGEPAQSRTGTVTRRPIYGGTWTPWQLSTQFYPVEPQDIWITDGEWSSCGDTKQYPPIAIYNIATKELITP